MTGKQLIVLALLLSSAYIYFSFQYINREFTKKYNTTIPPAVLHIEEENRTKTTTEIVKEIKNEIEIPSSPPINIEKKVIEVIEVIQAKKSIPITENKQHTEQQIIKKLIEKKPKDKLESEIEDALEGILTSQTIDK